jgi:hypothetical protein
MPFDSESVKVIAPFATPFITAIIETHLKPKLVELFKTRRTDNSIIQHAITNKFEEYLERSYEKQSYINVLVFQNQQKKLEDIYIPLTLELRRERKRFLIAAGFWDDLIRKYGNVLITDTAGMGKSTLMKYLFLSCIKQNKGIPIFIELRKLVSKTILEYIYRELNPIDDEFDEDFVLKLIRSGDFVFFFDGYDEIPFAYREQVTSDLQEFISKAYKNSFLVTSRPDSSLATFLQFRQFQIQPLELDEAFSLLRKYDSDGVLSKEIINKLSGRTLKNVREFLTNPLLVSLLYKSYDFKHTIPFKKHIFYRQVFDALFESHDLTKPGSFTRDKYSHLAIDDFDKVLRVLAYITVKLGQVEYSKDQLLENITEAKERCPALIFKESDFLKDLLTTVPLLIYEGDYYRWSHKSLQEYFASRFICTDTKGKQSDILMAMARSIHTERYSNVLSLCYDMDYKTFRHTLIYHVLVGFLKFYDSTYKRISRDDIPEKDIHERKLLTFGYQVVLAPPNLILRYKSSLNGLIADAKQLLIRAGFSQEGMISYFVEDWGIIIGQAYFQTILALLAKEGEDIFQAARTEYPPDEKYRLNQMRVVTDNPDLVLNKRHLFKSVSNLISQVYDTLLDIDKCRLLKATIDEEISREKTDDFLLDKL